MSAVIPSPQELGLPAKYRRWRPHQEEAIHIIDSSPRATLGLMLPPGAGKSGIYMAWAVWRKKRVMFLTPSKMLQDQLFSDFKALGLLDLRGQANYTCEVTGGSVADAPCHGGYECPIRSSCTYFHKLAQAPHEQLVVSNPAMWMHNKHVLGDFDALVMDEGHRIFEEIARFSNITFNKRDVKDYFHQAPTRDWKPWASYQKSLISDMVRSLKNKKGKRPEDWDEIRVVKRLQDKLDALCDADPKTLIYQETASGWTWDCVWPGAYRNRVTTGAKKYVYTSGTMTRRTFRMLGYSADDYAWAAFPSSFPVKRCPVVILPAPALNYHSSPSELRLHQEVMDRFIDQFPNWRGLIHSGSYARAEGVVLNSRHTARMITHNNSKGLGEAKERLYASPNGILVSPAIVEGEDFAFDKARFQIIAKLPFTNPSDPIEAERTRQDDQYPWYTAAQKVMQARGRVMRSEDDFGVTAIADGAWEAWFYNRARNHFTSYFLEAVIPLAGFAKTWRPTTPSPAPVVAKTPLTPLKKKLDVKVTTSAPSHPRVPLFTENSPTKPTRRNTNVE